MDHLENGTVSFDDLRVFAAVAEGGSFVEAARRLALPPSTVSRRLAALEAALGLRLLHRTSRRVAPTGDGAKLLASSSEHLAALAGAVGAALEAGNDEPAGKLRVTATLMTGATKVAPALMRFAARYPKVEVELELTNAVVPMIERAIDVAFRAGPVTDGDLVARRIARWPFAFAAAPAVVRAHLGGKRRIDVDVLAATPAVVTRATASWRLARADGVIEEVRPRARFVANDPRVALAAAAEGLGIVAAPADAIGAYGDALVQVEVRRRTLVPREIYAVMPSRKFVPSRVRLAIDAVERAMRPPRGG